MWIPSFIFGWIPFPTPQKKRCSTAAFLSYCEKTCGFSEVDFLEGKSFIKNPRRKIHAIFTGSPLRGLGGRHAWPPCGAPAASLSRHAWQQVSGSVGLSQAVISSWPADEPGRHGIAFALAWAKHTSLHDHPFLHGPEGQFSILAHECIGLADSYRGHAAVVVAPAQNEKRVDFDTCRPNKNSVS